MEGRYKGREGVGQGGEGEDGEENRARWVEKTGDEECGEEGIWDGVWEVRKENRSRIGRVRKGWEEYKDKGSNGTGMWCGRWLGWCRDEQRK